MNKKLTIVGCGISAATLANVLANRGWIINIYEKQHFMGGNCYDSYNSVGVLVHNFGPHIFHTSYEDVYKFISKFTNLNGYVNKVLVNVDNKLFPLPINFKSIEIIMGDKAKDVINILKTKFAGKKTITLFDLRQIDNPIVKEFLDYISKNVYFNYSAKMWGKKFEEIDPNTINRVKIVLSYEHNYFPEDKYQGLPSSGYTDMIKKMLDHPNIHVTLGTNALDLIKFGKTITIKGQELTEPLVYCGPLDEALDYKYGTLPYRSLNIKFEALNKTKFQETAVVNYPAHPTMTRIAEYKQMTLQELDNVTTLSKEYPGEFDLKSTDFNVRYYPIINPQNTELYQKYASEFKKYPNFYPLGRLSQYKYFDMDDAIKQALE
ncbi:MAG: UDP-galactopyranose mutase, partial [Mycoplasma sp.]|nr:UDP-galactopyranose mutase [Candidatus Hennigella equi]